MTRSPLLTLAAVAGALLLASPAQAAYQYDNVSWGGPGSAAGQFTNPGLLSTSPDGSFVYVADTGNNRVQEFTADGALVTSWGSAGAGSGQFNTPTAVATSTDGTSVYVVDQGNSRIQRFTSDGATVLGATGTPGAGDGQFNTPTGIAVAPNGDVFVGDSGNHRVERFTTDLAHQGNITSTAPGGFGAIVGLAVGSDGALYVVDSTNARVERITLDPTTGAVTSDTTFGSTGTGDGQFAGPAGISANAGGVYVADTGNNRVEKFTTTGAFQDSLDAATSGDPALSGPSGVAVTSTTSKVFVGQPNSARVSRYTETTAGGGGGGGNLPPPTTGENANAVPVSGTIKVKKPGSADFELLTAGEQIPIGSIVDVTNGTVALTTTKTGTTTQTANFFAGVFQLLQDKSKKPVTVLKLFGGNFKSSCGRAGAGRATASAKKKVVRQLWGVGKGRFRTKGRYAAASIRGTEWLTQDRCDGTNVRVKQGSVTVQDLVKKISVVVRAPKSYFAAAKAPRRGRHGR